MPFPFLQVRCIRIGRSGSRETLGKEGDTDIVARGEAR